MMQRISHGIVIIQGVCVNCRKKRKIYLGEVQQDPAFKCVSCGSRMFEFLSQVEFKNYRKNYLQAGYTLKKELLELAKK